MNFVLDEDALKYLQARRASSATTDVNSLDPVALRKEETQLRQRYGHGPKMHREVLIPASGNMQSRHILEPVSEPEGTLLYFHGGGWVMGNPEDYLAVCRAIAAESNWRVIVADYRKAPEFKFPSAFNDCVNTFQAVFGEYCTDAADGPVVIGGDSAGANLAATVAIDSAQKEQGKLAAQLLITPVLDVDVNTDSYLDEQRQLTLTRELMAWFIDQYLPADSNRADWRVAPLLAPNFSAFPSTLCISVRSDVLYSEINKFLTGLEAAGVRVSHMEFLGQMHGFFQLYNVMPAVQEAVAWIGKELKNIAQNQ